MGLHDLAPEVVFPKIEDWQKRAIANLSTYTDTYKFRVFMNGTIQTWERGGHDWQDWRLTGQRFWSDYSSAKFNWLMVEVDMGAP